MADTLQRHAAARQQRVVRMWHFVCVVLARMCKAVSPPSSDICAFVGDNLVPKLATRLGAMFGHANAVHAMVLTADGALASASSDHSVRVWRGGRERAVLEGHSAPVCHLCVLPRGGLASGALDCSVVVWRRRPGATDEYALVQTLDWLGSPVCHLLAGGEAQSLLVAAGLPSDGRACVWARDHSVGGDADSGRWRRLRELLLPDLPAGCGVSALAQLAGLPGGDGVAVGYTHGYVAVWACRGGPAPLWTQRVQQDSGAKVRSLVPLLPSVRGAPGTLVCATQNRFYWFSDPAQGRAVERLRKHYARDGPMKTHAMPGGYFAQSEGVRLYLWGPPQHGAPPQHFDAEAPQGAPRTLLPFLGGPDASIVLSIARLPSGCWATGHGDMAVRLWHGPLAPPSVGDRARPNPLRGHTGGISCLVAMPGGVLASAGADGSILLWSTGM